jgi:hypothetical protein
MDSQFLLHQWQSLRLLTHQWKVTTGKRRAWFSLRKMESIRSHMWHRYYGTFNKIITVTRTPFIVMTKLPLNTNVFSSFFVSSNSLLRNHDKNLKLNKRKKILKNKDAMKNTQTRQTFNIDYPRRGQKTPKTLHNMRWTRLCASKHKWRIYDTSPPTNNWRVNRTQYRIYAEIVTEFRT